MLISTCTPYDAHNIASLNQSQLTPDENLKFGGAKGGNKYSDETCDVTSETAVLGKLTLATIDSVIQDLHRLGCKRKVSLST